MRVSGNSNNYSGGTRPQYGGRRGNNNNNETIWNDKYQNSQNPGHRSQLNPNGQYGKKVPTHPAKFVNSQQQQTQEPPKPDVGSQILNTIGNILDPAGIVGSIFKGW